MTDQNNEKEAIFVAIDLAPVIFLIVSTITSSMLVLIQRRQWRFAREKFELKAQLVQTILLDRIDRQNNLLKHFSKEIHDKPGQLLFVAKINLNILEELKPVSDGLSYLTQTNLLLTQTINELRVLMRQMEEASAFDGSLIQGVRYELEKIRAAGHADTHLTVNGNPYRLLHEQEIVLLTIVKDILGLVTKYAGLARIRVTFCFEPEAFRLSIWINHSDWGKCEDKTGYLNLLNQLTNRCRLIDFACHVDYTDRYNAIFNLFAQKVTNAAGLLSYY